MMVHDVTGREADFKLDDNAFCYAKHGSSIANEIMTMSDDDIKLKYYPETADLIQKL